MSALFSWTEPLEVLAGRVGHGLGLRRGGASGCRSRRPCPRCSRRRRGVLVVEAEGVAELVRRDDLRVAAVDDHVDAPVRGSSTGLAPSSPFAADAMRVVTLRNPLAVSDLRTLSARRLRGRGCTRRRPTGTRAPRAPPWRAGRRAARRGEPLNGDDERPSSSSVPLTVDASPAKLVGVEGEVHLSSTATGRDVAATSVLARSIVWSRALSGRTWPSPDVPPRVEVLAGRELEDVDREVLVAAGADAARAPGCRS